MKSVTYALSLIAVGGSLFATWVSLRVATHVQHAWYEWVILVVAVLIWLSAPALIVLARFFRPRLRVGQGRLGERAMSKGPRARFAYVEILNKPRIGSDEARDVHGQVTFFDYETAKERGVIERAQWEHIEPSLEAILAPEITIPASRGARRLTIAYKNDQKTDAHLYGDEDLMGVGPGSLPAGKYRVLVELFGSNVRRAEGEFLLSHDGVDSQLQFVKTTGSRK